MNEKAARKHRDGTGASYNLNVIEIEALLRAGPKHGYELKKELDRVFGRKTSFGSLYPLLRGLERDGNIKGERETGKKDAEIIVYALTSQGREKFKKEIERISLLVSLLKA